MLFGAGLLLLASLVVTGIIAYLRGSLEDWSGEALGSTAWTLALFLIPFFISFLFCLVAFRYLPRIDTTFRDVWPGALLAGIGFEVLKSGYAIYIAHFSTYDEAYGAIGSVLMLLFFIYLAFYMFYFGAEVAYVYPAVRDGTYVEPAQATEAQSKAGRRGLLFAIVGIITGLFITQRHD